ncbi:MAG: LysR family transcriptional regulator [Burkholderiales bacterium]|jgi:DNA-binding transcriptional LysR family regulator|nr:LysR family transcriptional regulator [Burkholderiales bacterium]
MKNLTIDTDLLLLFKALHETRSLTLTASRLNISQAAASRALSKLRAIFSDNLFIKSGYGMLATPRAEALYPLVQDSLTAIEQLTAPPEKFDPASLSRVFRVGGTDDGVFTILSSVLQELFSKAPRAQLDIIPISDDLYTCLKDGRMDIAIHPVQPLPPDFHEYRLFEAHYACVVRECHPLAHYAEKRQAPPLEEINRYRRMQISIQQGGKPRYVIDDVAFLTPPAQEETAMWVPYFLAAPLLLTETDFVLTLPRQTAEHFAKMAPLVIFPSPAPSRTFFTRLIWHHRVHHDPAIQWLRSLFVKHVADKAKKAGVRD